MDGFALVGAVGGLIGAAVGIGAVVVAWVEYYALVTFDFTEKSRGPDNSRHTWLPFADNDEFNPNWWNRPIRSERYTFFEVREDGVEVARVELDSEVTTNHYIGNPRLDNAALEIQFIEVAASQRRRGVGTKIVQTLAARYPDRRLLAFSEEADDFWASLGWERYDHPDGPMFYRPLFICATPGRDVGILPDHVAASEHQTAGEGAGVDESA